MATSTSGVAGQQHVLQSVLTHRADIYIYIICLDYLGLNLCVLSSQHRKELKN